MFSSNIPLFKDIDLQVCVNPLYHYLNYSLNTFNFVFVKENCKLDFIELQNTPDI